MALKTFLASSLLAIAILTAIIFYNTSAITSKQVPVSKQAPEEHPAFTKKELGERLAGAIRIQTISYENRKTNTAAFIELHKYLESKFPRVYSKLIVHKVGENSLSLLFEWPGLYHGTAKDKPLLLTSHLDVVPVPEDTLDVWSVDPFAGVVDDEFIWGRGTIDDKQGVLGILEAGEWLLGEAHQPDHTIYFGFGHDEELSGFLGAAHISQWFKDRNIKIEYLVDEGLTLIQGFSSIPITKAALIGIAEKGSVTVELSTIHKGGHASTSTKETAVDIISAAIRKVYENPMKSQFTSSSPFRKVSVNYLNAYIFYKCKHFHVRRNKKISLFFMLFLFVNRQIIDNFHN